MNIKPIATEYIKLSLVANPSEEEIKLLNSHKRVLTAWSSMGKRNIENIFKCIINHDNPSSIDVNTLNSISSRDLKEIICDIFCNYIENNIEFFSLENSFVTQWSNSLDELSEDAITSPKINDFILKKYIESRKTLMYKYILDNHFSNRFLSNKLVILKGWSSATPIINSYFRQNYCNGGGFYININGTGIVIDPGCNFIKNMHEQGIRIFDINYIIITHNHIDHNASMMELQNLNYEYNNYISNNQKILKRKKLPNNPNVLTWIVDKETEEQINRNKDFSAKIDTTCIDEKGHTKSKQIQINEIKTCTLPTNVQEEQANNCAPKRFLNHCNTQDIKIGQKEEIRITLFRTYHMKDSFGIKIRSKINALPFSLGYTSDTGYFKQLPQHLNGCDILIENISELAKEDLSPNRIQDTANHLKLNGCIQTINQMKKSPQIAIISEFWGGKDDIRLFIVNKIQEQTRKVSKMEKGDEDGRNTKLLAADLGLTINLKDYSVKCSSCGEEVAAKTISTSQDSKYGRLKYLCKRCNLID